VGQEKVELTLWVRILINGPVADVLGRYARRSHLGWELTRPTCGTNLLSYDTARANTAFAAISSIMTYRKALKVRSSFLSDAEN
jgi:hypothetical protein